MWIEKTKNNKKLKRGEFIMKYVVTINGKQYDVEVEKVSGGYKPMSMGAKAAPAAPAPAAPAPAPAAPKAAPVSAGDNTVTSPMPGTILGVKVKEGDAVKAGQLVIILEAMKMGNPIMAPCDGKITSLSVSEGQSVQGGDSLFTVG